MRDTISDMQVKRCISPISVADTTAQVGQIIDRQGYQGLGYVITIGSVADADATFVVLLEEGDDSGLSDAAAVADIDMISQTSGAAPEASASFAFDSDNQVRKLGYIGSKRYTRLTITPAANSSAAVFSAVALLEYPSREPVTQGTA